jgi:ATP-dependent helicase HrpA
VGYAAIDPVEARAVFLREALLTGEIDCRAAFVRRNLGVLEAARREEAKRRRHGLLRPDDQLVGWLDARIPAEVNSAAGLDAWYRTLDGERRAGLEWTLDDVLEAEAAPGLAFPEVLAIGVHRLNVEYRFEPGHVADGATLVVPLKLLNALPAPALGWLVPGLLPERVTELIRLLPKPLRRHVVPAPDFARAFVAARGDLDVDPARTAMTAALSAWLERTTGIDIPADAWQEAALPPHLSFNLRVVDEQGEVIAESRDLAALRRDYGPLAREAFARQAAVTLARDGITRWDFGDLPESVETDTGLAAWPALVDRGDAAAIRVFESRAAAAHEHGGGVERLLRIALAEKLRSQARQLPLSPKVAIAYTVVDSPDRLRGDVVESALVALARPRCAGVRTAAAFESLVADVRVRLGPACAATIQTVEAVLAEYAALLPRLKPPLLGFARANFDELRAQLTGLVHPGFVLDTPAAQLTELPRYIKAMGKRVERLLQDPRKDQQRMLEVGVFVDAWRRLDAACDPADTQRRAAIDRLRWLIEEYRVQLFAQELKTREPVSDKRLRKLVDDLGA